MEKILKTRVELGKNVTSNIGKVNTIKWEKILSLGWKKCDKCKKNENKLL